VKFHHFSENITGDKYRELLRRLLEVSASFSLVLRDDLSFRPESSPLLEALAPFERERGRRDRWPGTQTSAKKKPLVAHFRSSPEVLETLCVPGSIFAWCVPRYPEDLAFYDHDGKPMFATTAHDSDAWVIDPIAVREIANLVTLEIVDVRQDAIPIILGTY
jgi:hypothetical protein